MHGRSLDTGQWKPVETTGNHVVPQRDFGGVAAVRELHVIAGEHLNRLTFSGALADCLRHDGREDQEIAKAIHISKGYLSKLLRSVWYAQARRLVAFMRETRCIAPLQWIAHQVGCDVVQRSTVQAELALARSRLAELERQARAA